MTIEITGAPEPPASDPPDLLQQDGVQTQDQASDTTVLITEAEVALGTAAATGVRRKDRAVGCATEPDLRARAEGITPEAASLPTPHGVSGALANGTRDGATVSSFFVVAFAATLALATAEAKPHSAPVSRREKGPTMLSATLGIAGGVRCRWVRDGVPMTANSPSSGPESASSTIDSDTQARRANDGELSAGFQSDLTIDEDAVDGLLTAEEPADGQPHESVDSAQLYAKYRRLAAEQAALRRLATLVARGIEPMEVFGAVAEEMRRCVPADTAGLSRFETDGELTLVAATAHPAAVARWPVGTEIRWKAPPSLRWYYAPAGPHGSTATTTLPGRSPLACARWACGRRWGRRSSLMDACGARRRSVRCNPARCQPTPRGASAASPN